ncbi:hypothetical protein ACVIJ6_006337 [Bradyrhizobium sp. USDA 4369]
MAENIGPICPTVQALKLRQTGSTGNLRMRGMPGLPVEQTN